MKNIPTAKNNIKRLAEIKYFIPEKNLKVTYHFTYYYYYYYLIFFFYFDEEFLALIFTADIMPTVILYRVVRI